MNRAPVAPPRRELPRTPPLLPLGAAPAVEAAAASMTDVGEAEEAPAPRRSTRAARPRRRRGGGACSRREGSPVGPAAAVTASAGTTWSWAAAARSRPLLLLPAPRPPGPPGSPGGVRTPIPAAAVSRCCSREWTC